jgi:hypothetical protein
MLCGERPGRFVEKLSLEIASRGPHHSLLQRYNEAISYQERYFDIEQGLPAQVADIIRQEGMPCKRN